MSRISKVRCTPQAQWAAALVAIMTQVSGQTVEAIDGNVFYKDPNERVRQLTFSKMDADPALSRDGKSVIFIRRTTRRASFEEPRNNQPVFTQVWVADSEGRGAHLVFGGPATDGAFKYASFSRPNFSPDGRHAYFLIPYAAVVNGLVRLDLSTHQARVISSAVTYEVITTGNYAGTLVVLKRKDYSEGATYSYYLIDAEGREIGVVGSSENQARSFAEDPNRHIP
jgi:hypothetical protein